MKSKQVDRVTAIGYAKKVMTIYRENLFGEQSLAWWLGSKSFTFFNLYYLQDLLVNGEDKAELSLTHFEIWQELENSILIKDYKQREYICPRGFGKTTTISIPFAIWCHVYGYKNYTVLASAVASTAEGFLASIKDILMNNKYIEKSFGKLINTKQYKVNSELIQLTNRSAIQSISASGAIRGKQNELTNKRIELLICDDYQTTEECRTEQQRDKKWKTFNADAKNAMQKDNSTIIATGTVQHDDDFYSRLKKSPTWKTRLEKGVLIDNLDDYFTNGLWKEFHKLLVNNKDDNAFDTAKEFYLQNFDAMQYPMIWNYFDCLDYAVSYYEDKETFMQEVQNDTSNVGTRKFKTIVTETAEEIETHRFVKTMLVVDPAGTRTKASSKKKDYYAFAVCSTADTKIKYIRKGEIHKFRKDREYEDYIEHTLILLRKYEDITHLGIEKNTYGGADAIRIKELISQDENLKYRNIEILSFPQNRNKDDKISTIVPFVNLGQVIFNAEDEEGIKQMEEFCGCLFSTHDDFPDVVAEAVNRIDDIKVIQFAKAGDRSKYGL